MNNTAISWADSTHPFWTGCHEVSEGCAHCYAKRIADKFWDRPFHELRKSPDKKFTEPLRSSRRVIFPCSLPTFFTLARMSGAVMLGL